MPYQASMCRYVFQASVATTSPSRTPSLLQRLGATLAALVQLAVGVAVNRAFDRPRDDHLLAVVALRVFEMLGTRSGQSCIKPCICPASVKVP